MRCFKFFKCLLLICNLQPLISFEFAEQLDPDPQTVVVIGLGPTSLGFLYRYYEQEGMRGNVKILAFEEQTAPGGLAGSERDPCGFLFDFGGHVVFSHYSYFDAVLDRYIADWNHMDRASYIFMEGSDGIRRFIPYPIQNNIHAMGKNDRAECLRDLECIASRQDMQAGERTCSFKEWLLNHFGATLYDKFMYPYNKKVWAVDPSEMSAVWIREKIARPNLELIKSKVHAVEEDGGFHPLYPDKDDGWGPNHTFRFPKKGGTGSIWTAIANHLPQAWLHYGKRIVSLNAEEKILWIEDVKSHEIERIPYDALVSTMPLDRLIDAMVDPGEELSLQKAHLIHNSVHVVGLGIRGSPPDFLKSKSWIYFPDNRAPFYRVTLFSNYSSDHVPEGSYWSLLCEASERAGSSELSREKTIRATIDALVAYEYLSEDDIESIYYKKLDYGYPVPSLLRDNALDVIQPILESKSIYARGRFGGWKYEVGNQDHSFMQGVELADFLFKGVPEMTYPHPNEANAAGKRSTPLYSALNDESRGMRVEYVIAHYRENLNWALPIKNQAHIYHKGGNKISLTDFRLVEALPNIGREGHTYLKHIVDNYDRLADITFFFQGRIDDHFPPGQSPKNMYLKVLEKGVAYAQKIVFYSDWDFARRWLGDGQLKNLSLSPYSFGGYWKYIFGTEHPKRIPVSFNGCFAVTRERIHTHPKEFYSKILDTMDKGMNPEEGHYLERLWVAIFGI